MGTQEGVASISCRLPLHWQPNTFALVPAWLPPPCGPAQGPPSQQHGRPLRVPAPSCLADTLRDKRCTRRVPDAGAQGRLLRPGRGLLHLVCLGGPRRQGRCERWRARLGAAPRVGAAGRAPRAHAFGSLAATGLGWLRLPEVRHRPQAVGDLPRPRTRPQAVARSA